MAHSSWYYSGDSNEFEGYDDEITQAIKRQPYFMLECSKIDGASFLNEISNKEILDITEKGFLYIQEKSKNFFVLDQHCSYLLGVFDLEKKRVFQMKFDQIKEKAKELNEKNTHYTKFDACVTYQNIVHSFLHQNTDEYNKSYELLSYFKKTVEELKKIVKELEKEIEEMILEYILDELRIIFSESSGINIKGTVNHYLKFFINKKYYK